MMNPVPWLQMTNMISYQGLVRTFLMFSLFAFTTSSIGWNVVGFCVLTMFSIVITVMVMNIDLGRYQLATLTSVIESVRNKGVKLQ
ncbi:hypothetical protein [Enterobacter cloacae]|uniref:hypothetical protein n=1 Tax=Enterobacter cloacae TaxID=550 RepID=UPI001FFD6732|nr:hypothetical protein [Enterobacter cloacae]